MKALAAVSVLVGCLELAFPSSAHASDSVDVGSTGNAFGTDVATSVSGSGGALGAPASHPSSDGGSASSAQPGHWEVAQKCRVGGTALCSELAYCDDGSALMQATHTVPGAKADDPPVVDEDVTYCASNPPASVTLPPAGPSPDQIFRAFGSVVPPTSPLHFQPADNQTLVHFKSNYFTDGAPFDAAVDLPVGGLTYHVEFKVRPVEFEWSFGDGTTSRTTTPGAAYPRLQVIHEYQKTGTVTASVTTVWGADYRVNGGAWGSVNGTVTKQGAGISITVREATPVLTD